MSLPEYQRHIVYLSLIGPAAVGSAGCLFVIAMFASFRTFRSTSYMMIGILAVFDLLNMISFMLPTYAAEDGSTMCQLQAVGMNFSTLAGLIWTTFIAVYLYLAIKNEKKTENRLVLWSLFATILISIVFTIIPAVSYPTNTYGKNHGWCWIEDKYYILRDTLFFAPVLLIIPINFFIYLKVNFMITRILSSVEDKVHQKKIRNKLLLYPLILVVCYLPYTIKAFLEFFKVHDDEFAFTLIAGVLRCLHSSFNFCAYGMNDSVQKKVKDCLNFKRMGNISMAYAGQPLSSNESSISIVY